MNLYGEMGIQKFSRIVSQKREDPRRSDFSGTGFATNAVPEKIQQESSARSEESIHILESKFSIFAKMAIIRPLTPTFGLGQSSISSPILIR